MLEAVALGIKIVEGYGGRSVLLRRSCKKHTTEGREKKVLSRRESCR